MTSALARVLEAVVAEGKTPGAAGLAVARDGTRVVACAGGLTADERAARVDERTVFDLASLTKLLSTTMLAARAIDAGALSLADAPWPQWPSVTVEDVLRHDAGLPAWLPLYERASAKAPVGTAACRAIVIEEARAAALEAEPGARTLYSDLGFIALGALLEERLARPLELAFADAARATYGETGLRYVRMDVDGFHPDVPRVAPTERCTWRKHTVLGQPHDENCYAMGGVSGHAGLFGSLLDVEQAGRALLDAITRDPTTSTLARFALAPVRDGGRPIGFDRATPGGSTGDALGPRAVGHLGYTGTSLWLDPDLRGGALFVLLTNHVHFGRDKARILEVRQRFHRAAANDLRP